MVRGTVVINTLGFVRRHYGVAAHKAVLKRLPADVRPRLAGRLHESAWKPLEDLADYMEAARDELAPQDEGFFRRMGVFAGREDRNTRAFGVMLKDRETSLRMATTLWRSYFDAGRLEATALDASGVTLRIHDFPTRRCLCERIAGSLEGQQPEGSVRVEETACTLDGHRYCEMRMHFLE